MRNPLIHLARICWSAAAILTCLLSGCEPETIPAARVNAANLFSLRVNQLVDRGGGDIFPQTPGQNKYHVVVSDMNGRLVGYKELTANTSFVFEKPEWFAGDELMVTTVSKSPMHYTLVNTLRNVPVGSRWRMYPLEPVGPLSPQPVFYKSTLRLSNIPDGAVRLFSNDPSVLIVGEPKPGIDYELKIKENTGNDVWLGLAFKNNSKPTRYFLMRNVTPNSSRDVDASVFVEGRNMPIALPPGGYRIDLALFWADWENKSMKTYESFSEILDANVPFEALPVSHPNANFEKYVVYADISRNLSAQSPLYTRERHWVVYRSPKVPEKLPVIQADFSMQGSSAQECRFSVTGNSNSYHVEWNANVSAPTADNPYVGWTVEGNPEPDVVVRLPEIPLQLLPAKFAPLRCVSVELRQEDRYNSWKDRLEKNWAEDRPQETPKDFNLHVLSRQLK